MLVEQWNKWAARHAATFGLTSDGDAVMFAAWREVFSRAGYAIEELHEATDFISVTNPPRWRNEHLAAINRRINERRRAMMLHNQAQAEREGAEAHALCDGTGRVYVPHLSCVIDGNWTHPWYTTTVLCTCQRGTRIRESFVKPDGTILHSAMGIEQYTLLNGDWRKQMSDRRHFQTAVLGAQALGSIADKKAPIDPKLADLAEGRKTREASATRVGREVDEVLRKAGGHE